MYTVSIIPIFQKDYFQFLNMQCPACTLQHSDAAYTFDSSQLVDYATENAEPLEPRYALTANKCEATRCEHLHLMLFGGTSEDTVIAETTLGKRVILQLNNTMCSLVFLIYTQLTVLILTRKQ